MLIKKDVVEVVCSPDVLYNVIKNLCSLCSVYSSVQMLLIWWLLAVSRITMLVKRDVVIASASLEVFNKNCRFVLMSMYSSVQYLMSP